MSQTARAGGGFSTSSAPKPFSGGGASLFAPSSTGGAVFGSSAFAQAGREQERPEAKGM